MVLQTARLDLIAQHQGDGISLGSCGRVDRSSLIDGRFAGAAGKRFTVDGGFLQVEDDNVRVVNAVLGDWSTAGIVRWSSGFPFSVFNCRQCWSTNWNLQGNAEEQAKQVRSVMATVFPEAVALVRTSASGDLLKLAERLVTAGLGEAAADAVDRHDALDATGNREGHAGE